MQLSEMLAGLEGQAVQPFVESPELLAFGPLAHRVAQLRLLTPPLGDHLMRLSRPHWHAATAYIAATRFDTPDVVASRLLAKTAVELMAEALQPLPVPMGYLALLRHAPATAIPIECHRLLAQRVAIAPVGKAFREVLPRHRIEIADGIGFSRLVCQVASACELEPLVTEVAGRLHYDGLDAAARLIRAIRVLGLLGPDNTERRSLRRVKNRGGLALWAMRRLRKAHAPADATAWLKVPVRGCETITSGQRLVEVARMLGNCAYRAGYLMSLAAGTSCFALVTVPGAKGTDTAHLVNFRVGGSFVEILEWRGPTNADPLRSATHTLQRMFHEQGLRCLPTDIDSLSRDFFTAMELGAEFGGWPEGTLLEGG